MSAGHAQSRARSIGLSINQQATGRKARRMYSSTFIFATRQFDDDFHRLDQEIAAMAKAIPGYLGEESWENPASGLVSNVYYWESLEALQQLVRHPKHLEAKAKQGQWLAGYQVVISQVLKTYGDAQLGTHPLPLRA
jgi:heme-degrading monooxygenase HmoA